MAKAKELLSTKSKDVFQEFDSAAREWGLTQEHGYGPSVAKSEKRYTAAKEDMEKRLLSLERQLRICRRKAREYKVRSDSNPCY